jgi:hypothetical protein
VRRAGRITQSQQRALDELWPVYGTPYSDRSLEFDTLFGTDRPVVVEIGFGNGETLVEQAAANPDRNFLGIEVHEPGVGHCMLRANEAGIENLRIIAHDAIDVLTHQVPPDSLARLNLYFPDPWPKKRHHKRRIVQPAFLDLPTGQITPSISTKFFPNRIDLRVSSGGNTTATTLSIAHGPSSNGAACGRDTAYTTGASGRTTEEKSACAISPKVYNYKRGYTTKKAASNGYSIPHHWPVVPQT